MSFTEGEGSVKCKSFISEAEIEERNKKRQEEWDKVRNADDPVEVPEEEYDPRSLYDRLEEQKEKRQAEFEETHKLKNLIKGLDDDEISFLELVDKTKIDMETKLWNEEMEEIQKFKQAVANLSEEESKARLNELRKNSKLQNPTTTKKSQQDLLAAAVKRKAASNGSVSNPEKKQRLSVDDEVKEENVSQEPKVTTIQGDYNSSVKHVGVLQCLGVLPGLGAYSDSSDSENSSISENEKETYDLIGRKKAVEVVCEKPKSRNES